MKEVFIILLVVGIFYCSANDLILAKERIRYLEKRVNSESKFRHEDYSEIIYRLDEIDKVLNTSLDRRISRYNEVPKEIGETSSKTFEHLKDDFTRIRKAFVEEKAKTARIWREIPNLGNDIKAVQEEVDNYCKISLNKTVKSISKIKETSELIISEVSKKHITLLNEINENAAHDSTQLKDIVIKLEQLNKTDDNEISKRVDAVAANVELNNANIVRIQSLLLSLFFEQSSCKGLLNKGISQSGIYLIRREIVVYCDQTTDGGGWIVFQRRLNGEVDFYRNWADYKNGFGALDGEFWLGNRLLNSLTAGGELRIDMEDFDGNSVYAKYSKFNIEFSNYKLEVSGYSGTAGDALYRHNGMMFSTFDRDNDKDTSNCAVEYHGAWWYNDCYHSNLNGKYYNTSRSELDGIHWRINKFEYFTAKKVEMKFR